ncbi:hypothetical protein ACH41H_44930 [Streptomyces sp. NPDC020800]|uniref:hypothetical protein n=1 Tax=Streptomyces sp. NPDC020800 TaxID=3365092 RepID=UPI0037BD60D2
MHSHLHRQPDRSAKQHPVIHARPSSPEQWQDIDARYFEAIEGEINRRFRGGDPGNAPWRDPRYFDIGEPSQPAVLNVLTVLRHWSGEALTQLIAMSSLLRSRLTGETASTNTPSSTAAKPCTHTDQDVELNTRTRRKDDTLSPPEPSTHTTVTEAALCN